MMSRYSPPQLLRGKGKVASALVSLALGSTLVLSACGSSSAGKQTTHVLRAICSVGGSYTQNMSPFNPNMNCGVPGILYENLEYVNGLTGQETPMLATGHSWSSDNKTLTFTIREGVKWSDDKPFSANDVAFTFNMLKQYPDADAQGLWNYFSSVTAPDAKTVVITFTKPAPTILPFIEGTYIVPQHVWSTVGDPAKYQNTSPVGTGPMKLKSFSAQLITYVKNPNYWQADKVKVDELQYPVVNSNNTALLQMASGQADWTAIFDPAVQSAFVQKDPAHNFSYPVPVVPVMIVPNLTDPLLSQLPVRQAISAALDRDQMGTSGEAGFEKPASPTGLIPGQEQYLDPKYNGQLPSFPAADPAKAMSILDQAGFKKGSDGIYTDGKHRFSFSVTVPGDYSDYVADLNIAVQNLKAAGIELKLNKTSDDAYRSDRAQGKFQLLMSGGFFGPSPYYFMDPLLNSAHIGGTNGTNWEQWKDNATDQLLAQYAGTTDPAVQKQALIGLSNIIAEKLPVIPVLGAVQFFEYSTKNWTGWPTAENPYCVGSAYNLAAGDNGQVILHLQPAS